MMILSLKKIVLLKDNICYHPGDFIILNGQFTYYIFVILLTFITIVGKTIVKLTYAGQ